MKMKHTTDVLDMLLYFNHGLVDGELDPMCFTEAL